MNPKLAQAIMAVAGIITPAQAYAAAIEGMRQEVVRNKEKTIQDFIAEEMGGVILDMSQVTKRCHIKVYPDGAEILYWDEHPRILFHAVAMVEVDGKHQVVQQFERLTADDGDKLAKYLVIREADSTVQPVEPEGGKECELCGDIDCEEH